MQQESSVSKLFEGNLSDDIEIEGRVARSFPGVILFEGHVHYPVKFVFNRPMCAHDVVENFGACLLTADVIAGLLLLPTGKLNGAFAGDPDQRI
jgi:hypothetical protein